MTINTAKGGTVKPIDRATGLLHYAPVGTDVSAITATSALPAAFVDAGAITTDGITIAANTEAGEALKDFNGNTFDYSDSTAAPTITLSLLEFFGLNAQKLVYNEDDITADKDGNITKIGTSGKPKDYCFVITARLKGKAFRIVLPHTTDQGRGDLVLSNEELISTEITRGILAPAGGGDSQILLYEV